MSAKPGSLSRLSLEKPPREERAERGDYSSSTYTTPLLITHWPKNRRMGQEIIVFTLGQNISTTVPAPWLTAITYNYFFNNLYVGFSLILAAFL